MTTPAQAISQRLGSRCPGIHTSTWKYRSRSGDLYRGGSAFKIISLSACGSFVWWVTSDSVANPRFDERGLKNPEHLGRSLGASAAWSRLGRTRAGVLGIPALMSGA